MAKQSLHLLKNIENYMISNLNFNTLSVNSTDEIYGFLYIRSNNYLKEGFIFNKDNLDGLINISPRIILTITDTDKIFNQNITIAMYVGSEYCYYAVPVFLKNPVFEEIEGDFVFIRSEKFILLGEDTQQEIIF